MTVDGLLERARVLLAAAPVGTGGDLLEAVEPFLGTRRARLLELAHRRPTPFYVLDYPALTRALVDFRSAFSSAIPGVQMFYAVKANPHPAILRSALDHGFGLDVSSGKELRVALSLGARAVVFTGPGKTREELSLAARHADRVVVHLDSERELERAAEAGRAAGSTLRVGVRVYTSSHGVWSRFGIPLSRLRPFWQLAQATPGVSLEGIQCHMSWNDDATPYRDALSEIADCLTGEFDAETARRIGFVDFGGGFWPARRDGTYPWATRVGELRSLLGESGANERAAAGNYELSPAVSLAEYAEGIAEVIDLRLRPLLPRSRYFCEPGRIICNDAMHVVLRVVEIKEPGAAVLDGGYNILGWEKLRNTYVPLVNLTHPARQEMPYRLYGSLCQADDVWGYACFAERIEEGDVILAPFLGAYTYALRHAFIRSVPRVYALRT